MSGTGPGQGPEDDPFRGLPIFGDLARMLQGQGPVSWDAARQFAVMIASEGKAEANIDPLHRIRLEELARVADLHVSEVTGLATSLTGRPIQVLPVTPGVWAQRSLEAYRPLFERLAQALSTPAPGTEPDELGGDPAAAFLGGFVQLLTPMMLGMAAGSMVGHLARRCFGQYDLPLPRPPADELLVLSGRIDEVAEQWSLPLDDLRLWVCVHELTHHAVLGLPHVRARLLELIGAFVSGFRPNPHALEERLGSMELADPQSLAGLQDVLGDPSVLLGAMRTAEQEAVVPQLDALVAVIVGYADHVIDVVGGRLLGSFGMLAEALRRQRVEADPSDRFVEELLGLSLGTAQVERGAAFVKGVLERAGETGLARLWTSARSLPTPAEVDAPGLWLARLEYDE